MGIVRIMGTAAVAGLATTAVRRRLDEVRQVRRSVAEYREHWRDLAEAHDPDSDAVRYVALGDSAAQAVGASTPEAGYVAAVAQHLAGTTGRDVDMFNLSVSGAKATDVLEDQLPRLAALGFVPDVVTLGIGGNDVVDRRISVEAFLDTMAEVLAELPPGSYVADPPGFLIPPFEARSDAMAVGVRPLIRDAGHHLVALHRATRSAGHLGWVRNVAADAFHPNDRGYAGWAAAFIEALESAGT
ncbi:MAG: SGNH/GDSL hydrolase family protein [Actinobacteria bacterium]|nr:SGNH/GDSL hydrolase family protein [Actinomycetota bacterium]